MQIVIDMPEWKYKDIREGVEASKRINYSIPPIFEAVANGTPLPKGHGDLVDASKIQFKNNEFDTYSDYSRAFDAIDNADAIIPADTESEEEE